MAVSQSLTLTESNITTSTNTSKVRILWQSTQTGESWNGYTRTAKYYVSINGGAEKEYMVSYTLPQNSTATIVDTTITVTHKSDGSGSVVVRTWMDTSISAGVVTQTKSLTLTTIPRASTIDALSCGTAYFNGTMTYKYTPKSASFYNRCNIALNLDGVYTAVKTINLGQKAASQQTATVTLSESELSIIYNKLPSTKKGTLRFTFRTYSDSGYSSQIGDAGFKEITLYIPDIDATKPTATMTLTPVSSLASPFNTLYIKSKSKVTVALASGAGKYGATITSYKVSVAGKSGTPPYTSGYLVTPGSVTITGTVTDSRGYSRKYTKTITVLDYAAPQIIPISTESEVVAARCDSSGNLSETGTYLKIKAKRSYSKVYVSGANKNLCYIRYRYKAEGGSYSSWTTILATTTANDEVVTGALLGGALSVTSTYVVQVQAIDTIGDVGGATVTIATERVYRHKAASINSFGFGEYVDEENLFSIAEDVRFRPKGGFVAVEIPEYTDFDTLTKPNCYYARYTYVPGYLNCPISEQTTFSLEVIAMGKDGQLLQRVTRCSADATVYERQYYSLTWHEWECVNPPMEVDVEYKTTERYMGKPVYTKLIYCDTLPNTTYKLFPHGAAVKQAIRCVGQMSDGNSLPFRFNATNFVEIYAGPENVVIYAGNDKTNRSAYAQMWYVKE